MSLALTPTIGFAEEPDEGGAVSFGQHRMDVIARSLLASRAASERERRRQLAATLLDARIDPSAPYRNWRGPGIGSRRAEGSIA